VVRWDLALNGGKDIRDISFKNTHKAAWTLTGMIAAVLKELDDYPLIRTIGISHNGWQCWAERKRLGVAGQLSRSLISDTHWIVRDWNSFHSLWHAQLDNRCCRHRRGWVVVVVFGHFDGFC
jgi:hypothetical protein